MIVGVVLACVTEVRPMPNYRRAFEGGRTWFFTVNLLDRRKRLLVDHIDALREAVRETRQRFPFEIDAMVVLPDHLHAVWTLPEGDCDFPVRWYLIKMHCADGAIHTVSRRLLGRGASVQCAFGLLHPTLRTVSLASVRAHIAGGDRVFG
jgi:REP element-mobilizing transposase RayT